MFQLTEAQYPAATAIFTHMVTELAGDYVYKYEVLRNTTTCPCTCSSPRRYSRCPPQLRT